MKSSISESSSMKSIFRQGICSAGLFSIGQDDEAPVARRTFCTCRPPLLAAILAVFIAALSLTAPCVHAVDGTWDGGGTGGIWGGNNNWNPNGVIATGAGYTAYFNYQFISGYTITVNTARTIGNIVFTDPANANDMILAKHASDFTLTLDVTSGSPVINVTQSGRTLTINPRVTGSDGLTKIGPGTLILTNADTYTGTTTVSAGTLIIGGAGSLGAGSYTGAITNNAALKYSSNAEQTFSGVISGSGSLTKDTATSILTLTGVNTYTGATTINAGTLTIGGAGSLGAGSYAVGITNNAALKYSSSAAQTFSGAISGSGSLTKDTENSILTLSGANIYTGVTQVDGGILNFVNKAARSDGTTVTASAAGSVGLGVKDSDAAYYSATDVDDLFNTNTLAGFNLDAASGVAIDTTNAGGSFDPTVALTAPRSLTKLGAGTLILSQTNTYTGTTTISGGTLLAAKAAALYNDGGTMANWTNTNIIVNSGSTLAVNYGGGGTDLNETQVAAVLSNLATSIDNNGLKAGSAFAFDTTNAGSDATYSPAITDSTGTGGGAVGVTKLGTGTLILAGNSTYTGSTNVYGGTLNITGSITGLPASSKINVNPTTGNNAIVNYNGGNSTLYAVTGATVANTASAFNMTGGTVTISPGITTSTQSVVGGVGAYGYYNITGGTFRDTQRFTVTGQGTASATNGTAAGVRTGVVFVGGTGFIDHTNAEWWLSYSLGQVTVADSGKIDHTGSSQPFAIFMDNTAGVTGGGYGVLNLAGADAQVITGAKPIRFGNSDVAGRGDGQSGFVNVAAGTLSVGANVSTFLPTAPVINNAYFNFAGGTVKATADLTGWIPLSSASINFNSNIFGSIDNSAVAGAPANFTGGLTVDTNTFGVTIANPLQAPGGSGVTQADMTVFGGSGYVGAPAVIFSSASVVAGGTPAAGYALISDGVVTGIVITDPGTYTAGTTPTISLIGGGGAGASVTAGALTTPNTRGGLTKVGDGTLTLTGANTYGGATTVSGGTLAVTGSGTLAGTSGLSVAGGATFSYLPTSIGIALTLGTGSTLTLNDGSTLVLAWDATAASKIAASAAATVGAGTGVAVNMGGAYTSETAYTILTAASGLDTGNYTFLNPTDYTAVVTKTDTSVSITPTTVTSLTTAFWKGTATAVLTNIWAASDGSGVSNWAGSADGEVQALVPGAGADVIISATSPTVVPTATSLGADMAIKTLTIADTTNGLGLNADGYTLTVTPGTSTDGIVMNAGVPASNIAASVALGANQTWTNNSANALTIDGNVSGAFALTVGGVGNTTINSIIGMGTGTLTKAGTGTLTLNGVNTYTGATTISEGTLELGGTGKLGNGSYAGAIAIANGATFQISGGSGTGLQTLSGPISGAGTLIQNGVADLALSNAGNTFGALSIGSGGGRVFINTNAGALPAGATTTISDGGILDFGVATNSATAITVQDGGGIAARLATILSNVTLPGSGTVIFNNDDATTTTLTISNAQTLTGNLIVQIGGSRTTANAVGGVTLSGAITGAGSLTADSANATTLTLSSAANTYSGVTTISGGIRIQAGPANISPNTTFNIVGTSSVGGQLFLSAGGTVPNNMTISGVGFQDTSINYGAVRIANGTVLSGIITLGGDARIAGHAGAAGTITGQITGSGGYGIEFLNGNSANSQTGTYTLQNTGTPNDYNGDTSISNLDYAATARTGCKTVLQLGAGDQIPNGTGMGNLVFNGADTNHQAIFELNGFNETINGVSNVAAAGAVIQNTSTGASMLTIGDADTTSSFSGTITDGGAGKTLALTKTGSGTLTLSGGLVGGVPTATSTFNGDVTISGGTIVAAAIASGSKTVLGNASNARTITVDTGTTLEFDAPNVFSTNFSSTAAPTLVINEGTVTNANPGALPNGVNNALNNVTLANGTLTATVGQINGYAAWNINGTITSTGNSIISTSEPTYGTVMLSSRGGAGVDSATTVDVQSGTLTISAPLVQGDADGKISGMIKTGAGTLAISGANTYTGATAVNAGTLTLDYTTQNTSRLFDTAALVLGGGTLDLKGGTHTEAVASTTLASGFSNVTRSGASVLQMGAITPAGGAVSFGAANIATTTNSNDNGGILGVWATIGDNWAANDGSGNIVAYTAGYTDIDARGSTLADGPATNVRILGDGTSGNIELGAATTTVNTLWQVNANQAATVNTAEKALVTGGIRINSGSEALTIGAAAGDGTLSAATAGGNLVLVNGNADKTLTVNAAIADNSTSALITTGNVTLNGANTYAGPTALSAGTLKIGGAGSLGSGAYAGNIANSGTLQYSSSEAQTLSGVISGSGAITKDAAGSTLTLSNVNTFSGDVTVSNGTLLGTSGTAFGAASNARTITVNSGATLTFGATGIYGGDASTTVPTLSIQGGTVTNSGANNNPLNNVTLNGGTLTSTGGNSTWGAWDINGTVTSSGTSSITSEAGIVVNLAVSGGTTPFNVSDGTLTVSTTLTNRNNTGTSGLSKSGPGTLTLAGDDTYTGATTVSEGTLNLTGNRTAAAGAVTVSNGGVLGISNGSFSLGANVLTVGAGSGTSTVNQNGGSISFSGGTQILVGNGSGDGIYNLSAGTLTTAAVTSRGIILGVNIGRSSTFNLSGTGTLTMAAGSILQIGRHDSTGVTGGTGIFNQTGSGSIATVGILSMGGGVASNSGTTAQLNLSAGTFSAASFAALSVGDTSSSTINISGTADVTLPAFPTVRGTGSTATITFDGGTLKNAAASTNYLGVVTSASIKAGGARFDTTNGSITITQDLLTDTVSTGGGLTKDGVGTLTLSGANTYTGDTTIRDGVLAISNPYLDDASAVTISILGGLNLAFADSLVVDTVGDLWLGLTHATPGTTYNLVNSLGYITGTGNIKVAGIAGDTDLNGVVDAADYIALKTNFGMTEGATLAQGNFDADSDGNVDWDDLQLLMANFSTRTIGGAPAIPEPATLGLLALGALAILRRRRK